jgi:hypothetical protein
MASFMRFCTVGGAAWVTAGLAAAQNVAPKVLLPARINPICGRNSPIYQTIRAWKPSPVSTKNPAILRRSKGQMKPLDTVRLEIVYADHREWYGSPGERNMSTDDPVKFIGSGMIGNGAFALDLNNIFEGANLTYRGQESLGGRMAVRYGFRVSQLMRRSRFLSSAVLARSTRKVHSGW